MPTVNHRSTARRPRVPTIAFVGLAGALWGSNASALPTPDVIAGTLNLVPLLAGTALAIGAGLLARLRRFAGEGRGTLLGGAIAGAVLPCLVLLLLVVGSARQADRQDRIRDLAVYLRCDLEAHQYDATWRRTAAARAAWKEHGRFRRIRLRDVAGRLEDQPDAALFNSWDTRVEYESGIPAVLVGQQLKPFTYARPAELPSILKDVAARDLFLHEFDPYSRSPEAFHGDKTVFAKFDNVFIVSGVKDGDRYVRTDDGTLRLADAVTSSIRWPVRPEDWVLDDARVAFPGIGELLSDEHVAGLLDDPDVFVVLPFDGLYRDRKVYVGDDYLQRLLRRVALSRVLPIDTSAADTTERLAKIATRVDGRRFLVAGLTKYDYIYFGTDVAFELWERLGHDPERFRLEGFTARLPEAVAVTWIDAGRRSLIDGLRGPFWAAVAGLQSAGGLSIAAALLALALLARLALSPLGVLEVRSRVLRQWIARARKADPPPAWAASEATLSRRLGVRPLWELGGGVLTLALVLPAYRILTAPGSPLEGQGFLWISDLARPDPGLVGIVGGLLLIKLGFATVPGRRLVTLSAAAAFCAILIYVPAGVLVWLCGVLVVTALQDLIGGAAARSRIRRAVLADAGAA